MKREITVTINADVTIETTEEIEETLKKMRRAEENDDWDLYCKLENKFEALITYRVCEEMKNIKGVNVLDINYE